MPRLLAAIFLLIALPTCLMFAVLVPPGQVADEPGHIARAAGLLDGHPAGERRRDIQPDGRVLLLSGIEVDPNLWHDTFILHPGGTERMDATRLAEHRLLGWSRDRIFAEIGSIAVYFPVFYLPAAAGLGVAKWLGATPYDAVVVGRLCAALCFMLLGAAAIALARRGNALIFCLLCAPMTLSLGASFNQDGLLIPASALAASLATRNAARARFGAAVLIGCVATVKLPYLPLVALLLVQPGTTMLRRVGLAALVSLPALAWTGFALATISAPVLRQAYAAGPLWPGDPAAIFTATDPLAQLRVLLADPLLVLSLPAAAILHDPWLLRQGIGVLGWLNVELPNRFYRIWELALACAVLADLLVRRDPGPSLRASALLAVAVLAAVWGIYLSQYLTWTGVGFDRIGGPSGRYLLPLVPLVAIGLPRILPVARPRMAAWAMAVPVGVAVCGLAVLPAIVVWAYYLR
jgi:uncharacterized membrane protein